MITEFSLRSILHTLYSSVCAGTIRKAVTLQTKEGIKHKRGHKDQCSSYGILTSVLMFFYVCILEVTSLLMANSQSVGAYASVHLSNSSVCCTVR